MGGCVGPAAKGTMECFAEVVSMTAFSVVLRRSIESSVCLGSTGVARLAQVAE